MTAVGLDLGGSKIEAQIFDADWALTDKRRVDTPQNYHALLNACLLYTSPSPRDRTRSRMPSSA